MSFSIILYKNTSDKNHMSKSLTSLVTLTGTLREDCSVINPVIAVEGLTDVQLRTANYCYIAAFGRFYYINNIICKGKLFELQMHVDVLQTYKSGILSNKAVIARQQTLSNLYLQDGVFKTNADPHYQVKQFPNGFNTQQFIFCVAG